MNNEINMKYMILMINVTNVMVVKRRSEYKSLPSLESIITLFIMLEPAARHSAPNQSWLRKIFVVFLSLLALSNQVDITNCSHYRHSHDHLIISILINRNKIVSSSVDITIIIIVQTKILFASRLPRSKLSDHAFLSSSTIISMVNIIIWLWPSS